MSQKHRSNSLGQAYLSSVAKNSFLNQNRKIPNGSPSKLNTDRNLTNNSTLESSEKKIAAAEDVYKSTPRQVENAEEADVRQDVQLKSKGLSSVLRQGPSPTPCALDDDNFLKTKSKLFDINFNHHDPELCVCAYCNCGRHLCKLHVVKPDMHINSIYRGDYDRKKPYGPLSYRPRSGKKNEGPHIDMKSMYGKEFVKKGSSLERPHPEDMLGVGGPSSNLTTYATGFPGHKGVNLYVKPKPEANLYGMLPFNGNSVYRNSYVPKRTSSNEPFKLNDTLRVGQPWMGNTTYRQNYKEPLDNYNTRWNPDRRRDDGPNYAHQYQTTYKNDFLKMEAGVCPAKIQLETKAKGFFNESKTNFNDNSDFKAMSPQFHAISTSKHSYV